MPDQIECPGCGEFFSRTHGSQRFCKGRACSSGRRCGISKRPSWDETFREISTVWASRSTCSRRQIGAVVVQNNRVIGQGYNGVSSGKVHCVDGGCPRGKFTHDEVPKDTDYNQVPCYALHAEMNAVLQAGMDRCKGATLYVTDEPCTQCSVLIKHVGIERVVVREAE